MRSRGFLEWKNPQPIEGEPRICGVDDDFLVVVECRKRGFVFAGVGGIDEVYAGTQFQPGPDQIFGAAAILPRPGDPPMTRLPGLSRPGAPSRSLRTISRRPGLVIVSPSGTPTLLPRLVASRGTNLANALVVEGLRISCKRCGAFRCPGSTRATGWLGCRGGG